MALEDTAVVLRLLLESDDLDRAFERIVAPGVLDGESAAVRVVLPGEVLDSTHVDLPALLASVWSEYEEIDGALAALRESPEVDPSVVRDDAVAFVSEQELSDPASLSRALAPLASEAARFEFLFAQAKVALERLQDYRLSRCSTPTLVAVLREERSLRTLQHLVEFLRALHKAADSFEALDLPSPHIRDYLQHLYEMGDWSEMGLLVHRLEAAVGKLVAVAGRLELDLGLDEPTEDGDPGSTPETPRETADEG